MAFPIGYACWKIRKKHPQANIVVTPADALVINTTEFARVMKEALDFTANRRAIVTIGIRPSRPETGYGYTCTGEPTGHGEVVKVEAFKEKPDLQTAEGYVKAGNHLWNAGIFVWNVETITEAMKQYGAVYFAATGGAGALIARCVKKCELVAFPDLGPEAIYRLEVEDFPLVVATDANGETLYR